MKHLPIVLHQIFRLFIVVSIVLASTLQTHAKRRGISLIRDAEIESLVRDYARPLMRAAGLRSGSVRFYIVNDNSFNAFVSGRGMFINTGLLLQSETPGEVIGVIAHELGHIVGGHQIRLRQRIETAARIARLTTFLGLGIGAAGAASKNGSVTSAGLSVAAGGGAFALRDVLRYQRSEESSADRTAATLLRKSKQSGKGMLRTFKRLGENLAFLGRKINPYTLSHPLPKERIANMKTVIKKSRYYNAKASRSLRERHDMMRAKIAAYVGGHRYASALLQSKTLSPNARLYGDAIVTHLYGSPKRAIPKINKLIKKQPKNAYAHEMKGEIMLRSGKASKAVKSFRKAVKLDKSKAGFIRIELGHALLQTGKKKALKEAVTQLTKGVRRDPSATAGFQYLAMAYAQLGNTPRALLASAELAVRTGKKREARNFAKRAQKGFKRGTPRWLRAEDIITHK
ncbi:MAG: M48 family metalloprotease [Rhizobiaceae bacterium]